MFGIKIKHTQHRRYLEGSRLNCPLSGGDVDIEACYACGRLLRLVDSDQPYVVCTARGDFRAPTGFV